MPIIKEKWYLRREYLGQGAYAKCYEVEAEAEEGKKATKKYACKIIEKSQLNEERKRIKVEQELQLH